MGDGAEWIWNLAQQHFPSAVQIIDLYHARQHLWDLARRRYPNDLVSQNVWVKARQKHLLDQGKISICSSARA
jgi:transposase